MKKPLKITATVLLAVAAIFNLMTADYIFAVAMLVVLVLLWVLPQNRTPKN